VGRTNRVGGTHLSLDSLLRIMTISVVVETHSFAKSPDPQGMKTMTTAQFITRDTCINCGASDLREVSSGLFNEGPLHDFLSKDPWGENPVPYLDGQRWRYVKCGACEQAFHNRILSPEWSAIKFSRWMTAAAIAEFERTHPINAYDRAVHSTKHVLQLASLIAARPLRVLDFGCGNGEFLAMCHQYGFEAFGVDRSEARSEKAGVRVVESVEELDSLPFHAITLFEVLEHVDHPRAILEMLRGRLAPGGILVLETPDCSGITGIVSRRDYDNIHPLEHINGFTPTTLRSIAERVGFKAIAKPVSHVTTNLLKVAKAEAKRARARSPGAGVANLANSRLSRRRLPGRRCQRPNRQRF